jgi:hypothetical protein
MYIVSRIIIFYTLINIIYKFYKNNNNIDIKKNKYENFSDSDDDSDSSQNTIKVKKINNTYKISKKNENIQETVHKNSFSDESDNSCEEDKNNYQLVIYKENGFLKTTNKIKHNLLEIYDNFFKGKKKKLESDIDINLFKKDAKEDIQNNKDIIIFSDSKNNYKIDKLDNSIIYKFNVKNNFYYKIKCKFFLKDGDCVENIKLIISSNNKRFLYNFCESNLINKNINEYGFILDNNNFNIDGEIKINFIFDFKNRQININNMFIEIIEKKNNNSDLPIIIFDVNKNYYPLYFDIINILDYIENINDEIFFI